MIREDMKALTAEQKSLVKKIAQKYDFEKSQPPAFKKSQRYCHAYFREARNFHGI